MEAFIKLITLKNDLLTLILVFECKSRSISVSKAKELLCHFYFVLGCQVFIVSLNNHIIRLGRYKGILR